MVATNTGMKHQPADEYMVVPTWLSALGLHYTQVAKIMGHLDKRDRWVHVDSPSVEHRAEGHVPFAIQPVWTPTLLGDHMANRIPGAKLMSDPVLGKLIDARNAKWIAQLEEDVKQSRAHREGLKVAREPKLDTATLAKFGLA